MFKPGGKVVCTDIPEDNIHLKKGETYVVAEVFEQDEQTYVQLEGIFKRSEPDQLCRWLSCRFRLADEEQQDFTKKECGCPIDVLMNQGCQCGGK